LSLEPHNGKEAVKRVRDWCQSEREQMNDAIHELIDQSLNGCELQRILVGVDLVGKI